MAAEVKDQVFRKERKTQKQNIKSLHMEPRESLVNSELSKRLYGLESLKYLLSSCLKMNLANLCPGNENYSIKRVSMDKMNKLDTVEEKISKHEDSTRTHREKLKIK